jgi:hypothetical protein
MFLGGSRHKRASNLPLDGTNNVPYGTTTRDGNAEAESLTLNSSPLNPTGLSSSQSASPNLASVLDDVIQVSATPRSDSKIFTPSLRAAAIASRGFQGGTPHHSGEGGVDPTSTAEDDSEEDDPIKVSEFQLLHHQASLKRRYQHLALSTLPYCKLKRLIVAQRYFNAVIYMVLFGISLVYVLANMLVFYYGLLGAAVSLVIACFAILGLVSSFAMYRPLYVILMIAIPCLIALIAICIGAYSFLILYYLVSTIFYAQFWWRAIVSLFVLGMLCLLGIMLVIVLILSLCSTIYMWKIVSMAVKQVRRSAKGGSWVLEMSNSKDRKQKSEKANKMAEYFYMTSVQRLFIRELDPEEPLAQMTLNLRRVFSIVFRVMLAISVVLIVMSIFLIPVINVGAFVFGGLCLIASSVGLLGCRRGQPTLMKIYIILATICLSYGSILAILLAIFMSIFIFTAFDLYYLQSLMFGTLFFSHFVYLVLLVLMLSIFVCSFASIRLIQYTEESIRVQKALAAVKADQPVQGSGINRYRTTTGRYN